MAIFHVDLGLCRNAAGVTSGVTRLWGALVQQ